MLNCEVIRIYYLLETGSGLYVKKYFISKTS